jgi:hypothetical protein
MEKCDKCGEFIEFARLCPLCGHYEKERLEWSAKKCEERTIEAEALARELVGVIDELRRQINQCELDDKMWEVYRTAKEVLRDD